MGWAALLLGAFAVVGFTTLILKAYPRPIAGIPYNLESAKTLLGDVPDLQEFQTRTGEVFRFMTERAVQLQSPIIQVFLRPLQKPWVVVCDAQESFNILNRRHNEFERSTFVREFFGVFQPFNMVAMKTDDHWRANRKLMADSISPKFLNRLARHQIFSVAQDLVKVWKVKMRLANGRAFDGLQDIHRESLESIWAIAFGARLSETSRQIDLLDRLKEQPSSPTALQDTVDFPFAKESEDLQALHVLLKSLESLLKTPFFAGPIYRLRSRLSPQLSWAWRKYNELCSNKLDSAISYVTGGTFKEARSANELLVHSELSQARKTGRDPKPKSGEVRDELMGFVTAGYETTGATMTWAIKLLVDNQRVQDELRKSLHVAFADGQPSADDIASADIPYLNATIEEILRCGGPISQIIRTANVDTEILGHFIPKGTEVFLMNNGPGYLMPSIPMKRTTVASETETRLQGWDASNIGDFKPERWLSEISKGGIRFNNQMGPSLAFGGGPRGCFGQKLARLRIRIVLVLIILNFKLAPISKSLSNPKVIESSVRNLEHCYVRLQPAYGL